MPQDLQTYFKYSPFFIESDKMTDLAWEQIQDKIDGLPMPLQDLLTDNLTSEILEKISSNARLSPTSSKELVVMIRGIIIGDILLKDIINNIATKLKVDPQAAKNIADQIVSQLFTPVMEELNQIHGEKPRSRETTDLNQEISLPPPAATIRPTPVPQTQGQKNQSFHEQNMGQKDIMEVGGNVLDLRNQ